MSGNDANKGGADPLSKYYKSKYQIVKDGWGSRSNFQLSHGLKMDPDGFEEGNRILDEFQRLDAQDAMDEEKQKAKTKK